MLDMKDAMFGHRARRQSQRFLRWLRPWRRRDRRLHHRCITPTRGPQLREQALERLFIHLGQDSIVMLALPILGEEYRYLLG